MTTGTVVAVICAVVLAGCGRDTDAPGASTPGGATGPTALSDASEVYAEVAPSVVGLTVLGPRGQGEGSGIVLRPDVVVTNAHVIAQAEDVEVVTASGDRRPAEIIAGDRRTDIALVRVSGAALPAAEFATDGLPDVGSPAIAIGNPLGFDNSVTAGIVSGVDRAIPSGGRTPALVGLLQTDAAISPGNSGGALVGPDGRVIGMNVAYIPPQARAVAIGFAIPASVVRDVATTLLQDGEVNHAYLGAQLRPLTPQIADRLQVEPALGAIVIGVEPGGPAAQDGLRPGDVIVEVGDRTVETVEDVLAELREVRPGAELPVVVARDGDRVTLDVTVGSRPTDPAVG